MKTPALSLAVLAAALAFVGCAAEPPTQVMPPAAKAAPSASAASSSPAAAGKAADGKAAEGTKVSAKVGNFRKVTKGGQTLYCEKSEFTGSKMTKTRCLTEDEFKSFQERNDEMLEDLNRAQRSVQPVNDLPSQPSSVPY